MSGLFQKCKFKYGLPGALLLLLCNSPFSFAQQVLETGGQKPMPDEWIDKDTRHKVIRLTHKTGENASFYFHNNPFISGKERAGKDGDEKDGMGDRMVFYSTDKTSGRQLYTVNLKTKEIVQLTHSALPMKGEIVAHKTHEVYYQVKDSVFATNTDTRKTKLVFVFPADFKGDITTVNADETLLGGAWGSDAEKEIFRKNPEKHDFFNKVYDARLPRTLFTIDVRNGKLNKLFTDSAWLNHVQFSPTDPALLMFCHEGPWHKVDRIWTINVQSRKVQLVHKRTMDMEIAGHEWFSPDGSMILFDQQLPRGATFYVGGTDLSTGKEMKYKLERNEWSVHYTSAPDGKTFAGDGGHPGSVAKAPDGQWIYLFKPEGDHFSSEKLVSLKHHNYRLEPNVHYSPDGKWIIFRANFEGRQEVYAVEIAKAD